MQAGNLITHPGHFAGIYGESGDAPPPARKYLFAQSVAERVLTQTARNPAETPASHGRQPDLSPGHPTEVGMVIDHTETDGQLAFQIYLPHAERVELVGDFTGWERSAIPMRRGQGDEHGWWKTDCRVPEGDHTFSYLVDGRYWMPDYAANGVHRNEFGHWTSNLSVQPPHRPRRLKKTA